MKENDGLFAGARPVLLRLYFRSAFAVFINRPALGTGPEETEFASPLFQNRTVLRAMLNYRVPCFVHSIEDRLFRKR